MSNNTPFLRQLFEKATSTYTYLIADTKTNEAVLIDPVDVTYERDLNLVRELGFTLSYALNTHVHADHITGTGLIKKAMPQCRSMLSVDSTGKADVLLKDGDEVKIGRFRLQARSTPGHTLGCMSYVLYNNLENASQAGCVFTGDTMLIRGCGRTDFQGGSSDALYTSVHEQLFTLPDDCVVYPAHDYKGQTSSTIGEEKKFNPRLTKTRSEFVTLMSELNLPYPKRIDASLPANLNCGFHESKAN